MCCTAVRTAERCDESVSQPQQPLPTPQPRSSNAATRRCYAYVTSYYCETTGSLSLAVLVIVLLLAVYYLDCPPHIYAFSHPFPIVCFFSIYVSLLFLCTLNCRRLLHYKYLEYESLSHHSQSTCTFCRYMLRCWCGEFF